MKKGLLLTLFLLSILRGVTLAQNIYESIGKKADVLTLSNGKYQEFFTNDTIVRIGTVLLNTKTKLDICGQRIGMKHIKWWLGRVVGECFIKRGKRGPPFTGAIGKSIWDDG